jgi:transposase
MTQELLSDEMWKDLEHLLPEDKSPGRRGGRPRLPAHQALKGILFVLKSGIPWEMLPQELGCGSGMTCWRRLRDWQKAGVWEKIHQVLLARLQKAGKINWNHAVVDGSNVRALFGGPKRAPILRIRPGKAANVTFSQTGMATRLWSNLRVLTATTHKKP